MTGIESGEEATCGAEPLPCGIGSVLCVDRVRMELTVGQPAGVTELLGGGKTTTHLVSEGGENSAVSRQKTRTRGSEKGRNLC